MTDFTNFIQNLSSDEVSLCTSVTDATNCQNWTINQSMIQSRVFAASQSPCSGSDTTVSVNSIAVESLSDNTGFCSALWDPSSSSGNPDGTISSLRPSDNIIATRTIWDGTNYELVRNYCNSDTAATNPLGNIDILVTNSGSDSMSFFAALNNECDSLTFSGSQQLVQGLSTGLQTVQSSSTDEVCVAFWDANSSSGASPEQISSVKTSNLTLAGTYYTWNNTLTKDTNYYTCPEDSTSPVPSGDLSSITVNPATVQADGTTTSTITITVVDVNFNPIPSVSVSVSATIGTLKESSLTTDTTGVATTTITPTTAGTSIISATIDPQGSNIPIINPATIQFKTGGTTPPNTPSASNSTITVSPVSVPADGSTTSTITITVLDVNSNPIPSVSVSVSATNSATVTASPVTTDSTGVATTTITSNTAGKSIISAVIDPQGSSIPISQTPTITFTSTSGGQPGPPSASQSTITVNPDSVPADGTTTSTITITVLDDNFNPIINRVVAVTATIGTVSNQTPTTDSNGVATTTINSTTAGTSTISATIGPTASGDATPISQTKTITFTPVSSGGGQPGPPSASQSTITVNPASVQADGSTTSIITITVLDSNSNPIASIPVSVTATNSATVTASPVTTGSDGVATTSVTSKTTGSSTISAVIDPQGSNIPISQTPTIKFTSTNGDANGDKKSFWKKWWWLIVLIIIVIIIVIVIIIFVSRGGKSKDTTSSDATSSDTTISDQDENNT